VEVGIGGVGRVGDWVEGIVLVDEVVALVVCLGDEEDGGERLMPVAMA